MRNNITLINRQKGVVLVVSLIMLLLLTIIGLTGTQVTSLEEKMTGNSRNQNLAFQSAESALRAGEAVLTQAVLPVFTASGANGLYLESATSPNENDNWAIFNVASYSANTLTDVAATPQYIIQQMDSGDTSASGSSSLDAGSYSASDMYRVTARAVGGTVSAVVVVQSIYKR